MSNHQIECVKCGIHFQHKGSIIRLHPPRHLQPKFSMQLLLVGTCPSCTKTKMNWVGVDYVGNCSHQELISEQKHDEWLDRILSPSERVSYTGPFIHHVVQGSVYDSRSGRYLFKTSIPVE